MPLIQPPYATPVHKPPMTNVEHYAKGTLCAAIAERDLLAIAMVVSSMEPSDAAKLLLEVADDAKRDRDRTAKRLSAARAETHRWKERARLAAIAAKLQPFDTNAA